MSNQSTSIPSVAVIGSGWRAEFFLRLAQQLSDQLTLVGVAVRRAETAERLTRERGVCAYLDPADLISAQRPDLVVVCVPWAATPGQIAELTAQGVRVLAETPPAPDAAGLRALWHDLGPQRTALVQVAEQYLRMPGHAARAEVVRRGLIGEPTSVQVSSTHGYHAVSMIRGLLSARDGSATGFGPTTVAARRFVAPLVDPQSRDGWTGDDVPQAAGTTIATLDFGDGRSGLYDFTDNQWHNRLRSRRIVVRGSHGEINDDRVVRLAAPETILRSEIVRSQLGQDLNLDGHDTEHLSLDGSILWRNQLCGLRLMDEELAIADVLLQAAAWAAGTSTGPYPLAEACQDHLLSLAIDESAATGTPVTTATQPWAPSGGVD